MPLWINPFHFFTKGGKKRNYFNKRKSGIPGSSGSRGFFLACQYMKIPTDLDPKPPLRRILAQNPALKEFLDPPLPGHVFSPYAALAGIFGYMIWDKGCTCTFFLQYELFHDAADWRHLQILLHRWNICKAYLFQSCLWLR